MNFKLIGCLFSKSSGNYFLVVRQNQCFIIQIYFFSQVDVDNTIPNKKTVVNVYHFLQYQNY